MAVLLPTGDYTVTVRAHPFARDAHGAPVAPASPGADQVRGPYPGSMREHSDETWTGLLDPRCWRVRPDDVISDGTSTWVVLTAQLNTVPGFDDADHIAITAALDPPLVP